MKSNVVFYVFAALTVIILGFAVAGLSATQGEGLVQPAPSVVQTSSAVQVPPILGELLNGVLIALMSAATAWLLAKVGWDLTWLTVPFSVSLSTFLLGLVQHWIDLQPVTSDPWIQTILNVLVVVLSGSGALAIAAWHRGSEKLLEFPQ